MLRKIYVLSKRGIEVQNVVKRLKDKYDNICVTTTCVTVEFTKDANKHKSAIILTDVDDIDNSENNDNDIHIAYKLSNNPRHSDLILIGNEDVDYYLGDKLRYFEVHDGKEILEE